MTRSDTPIAFMTRSRFALEHPLARLAHLARTALACAVVAWGILGREASAQGRADAGIAMDVAPSDAGRVAETRSLTDAGGPQDAGAPRDTVEASRGASGPVGPADPALPAPDDAVAERVLGRAEDDLPDPVADEGERTGSAEGEPLSGAPHVAHEIAALSDRACVRALRRAGVPFEPSAVAQRGIAQPIFVTGPIGSVTFRAGGRRTVRELMDCRLAVALFRWSRMLRALSVREVLHMSTYRPPTEAEAARNPVQIRHMGGMAIDAGTFVLDDGTALSVLEDFHGRLHRPVCGPDARVPRHEAARRLRTLACDSARRGFFHVVLTPHFNIPHRNHLHLEVSRGTSWQFVR
jgi:hypothetical protein